MEQEIMWSNVRNRNMWAQVCLMVITFGCYSFYWFYQTSDELKSLAKDASVSPALWTILLFIPIVNLYSLFKYCELYERVSSDKLNRWILLVLWLFFSPAVWFIVQLELNKRATA
jgi:hypothetical protein